jgi:hypothetical protein
MCLRHHYHFASFHHIIHHIASMTQEWNTEPIFGKYSVKVTRSKLRITTSSAYTQKRDISLRSMDIFIFTNHRSSFFTMHEKKGRCFFRRRLKNGMYVSFMHRKEINYNNLHIRSKVTHIKYYSFVTIKSTMFILVSLTLTI